MIQQLSDTNYMIRRLANDKIVHAIYNLPEDEIVETNEWRKDKQFIEELNSRYNALENRRR
jgi:hypothetical protein